MSPFLIAETFPPQVVSQLSGFGLLGLFALGTIWAFWKGKLHWESDSTIAQVQASLNRALDQLQASEAEKARLHQLIENQVMRQEAIIEALSRLKRDEDQ